MTTIGDISTYIPAIWLHTRAIVQKKGNTKEYVLRRLWLSNSREASSVELLPVEACAEMEANRDSLALRLSLDVVETDYEPTGRIMSILRVPL